MSTRKSLTIIGVITSLLLSAFIVNSFIYPFQSSKPNFADVERVFNRIQIPSGWVEVSSSENRGIAGRACPIEPGSACFHKSKTYEITKSESPITVFKEILETSGCPRVSVTDNSYSTSPNTKFTMSCSIDGLEIGGDLNLAINRAYVSVSS